MSQEINGQVLDYIELTGSALDAASKLASAELARQEKVASAVPVQVEALLQSKLISAEDRNSAIEKLSSHEGALNVVGNLVKHICAQQAEAVKQAAVQGSGKAEVEKKASVSSTETNYVGRRHGWEDRPDSYRRFEERMGL